MTLLFLSLNFCDLIFVRNHDGFEVTLKIIISFTPPLPHPSVCRILDSSSPCLTPHLANGNFKYVSMNKEASTGWYVKHLLSLYKCKCNGIFSTIRGRGCSQCHPSHCWAHAWTPRIACQTQNVSAQGRTQCSINVASLYCVMGPAGY